MVGSALRRALLPALLVIKGDYDVEVAGIVASHQVPNSVAVSASVTGMIAIHARRANRWLCRCVTEEDKHEDGFWSEGVVGLAIGAESDPGDKDHSGKSTRREIRRRIEILTGLKDERRPANMGPPLFPRSQ
ncbi:hypothetical protein [Hyphomicrobium sp.]|uniref:hypothetical protein n=1 Tax=Hyphomicrobium sp. TaxID=82 RepID=UPI002E31406E|nr:hypothetical protein [Hyphomicrobium sp.]HEX2840065.1 hypothetical protein [Hyphomicrobium sp.]